MFTKKSAPAVRLLSLILALAIALGAITPAAVSARGLRFTDISPESWYYESVSFVCTKQMMVGTSDNTFSPDAFTTRAMVVTVLHRLEGAPAAAAEQFSDVPTNAWYAAAVSWARASGIIQGYGDNTFHPDSAMTREEMMAIFHRYAQHKRYNVAAFSPMTIFSDHASTQGYAQDAMSWATAAGLIYGFPDGTIRPQAESNRAQLATVLMRFYLLFSVETNIITFLPNGDNVTGMPSSQYVIKGKTPLAPSSPSREGYVFAGWYTSASEQDLNRQFQFSSPLSDDLVLYARWIDVHHDSDGDRIPDEVEPRFGTDPSRADTDNDGLTDYEECAIVCTDPLKADTDGDQLTDFHEDVDGDGVSNGAEFACGSDPVMPDTDLDGLNDGEERIHGTDPTKTDTDSDGANDRWELDNGFDPTAFNDHFQITAKADASNVDASATAVLPGGKAVTLNVEPVTDHLILTSRMPGYIGAPFSFQVENGLEGASATISFTLDSTVSREAGFDPAIYYFDETRQLLVELPTTVTGSTYSTVVDHFSTYILLNRTAFNEVWENEIKAPIQSGSGTIDVVFVVDTSSSMSSNNRMTTAKAAMYTFLGALHSNDRGALVRFNSSASVLSGLTTDKASLETLVKKLSTSGQTAMYKGLQEAVTLLTDTSQTYGYKMIILLSDGSDVPSTNYRSHYETLVNTAAANDITIYTIGAGSSVDTSTLTSIASNTGGSYYSATVTAGITDAFEQIQGDTVDLTTDTDSDGLPDYYEPLLTSGSGIPFGLDPLDPDCDDDGLLDGDEILLTQDADGRVYGIIATDPTSSDTDYDSYSDYDELYIYLTDPLMQNVAFRKEHTDYLIQDENFVSDKYLDVWQNDYIGWLERACVTAGNAIGGKFDEVYLFKTILADYLGNMVKETEKSDEDLERLKLAHKLLSAALDDLDDAKPHATADDRDYLQNLERQLTHYRKNIEDIANSDYPSKGYSKKEVEAMFDSVAADYQKASEKIDQLKTDVDFSETIDGKKGFSFDFVMDLADLGFTAYEVYDNYVSFKSDLAGMQKCLSILDTIQTSPSAPSNLKTAANELYVCIATQQAFNADTFADGLGAIGGKFIVTIGVGALSFIPVVGGYIEAAKTILDLIDFAFNLSDVSEQCACLFAISKSSSIIAADFAATLSVGDDRGAWKVIYNDRTKAANDYFALAIMRKTSEKQMVEADKANSFLIEWLFANFLYKVADAQKNISRIEGIQNIYAFHRTA